MRRAAASGLGLVLLAAGGPAHADAAGAVDRLLDFAANGCVLSVAAGEPIGRFAGARGAKPANADLAGVILGQEPGTAYLAEDAHYPLVLAQRDGGPCTVNAIFPSNLGAVIAAVEDFFAGPGGGFYPVRAFEEQSPAGGWATHRIFVGKRRGRTLTLFFSTTPDATTFDQVLIAVAATKP